METCERCGAELGVGRFCLNCGHPIGTPVDDHDDFLPWLREDTYDDAGADDPIGDVAAGDVDRAEDDPDAARPPWLPWTAGAVVLVVLLLVLVTRWGGDDEDSTTGSDAVGGATTDAPTDAPTDGNEITKPTTKPVDVSKQASVTAPTTAPPTRDLDGQTVAYDAAQMLDGEPATAWRMTGDGTGTILTFALARPTEITRLGLVNGYAKRIEGVDWYPNNRRITSATWSFDDGSTVDQSFTMGPRLQTVEVDSITTSTVTLAITGVTPPGSGTLGRDYTAISEVRLIGRPAG